ncbi:MAG: hypothetical protein GY929_07765 [Actinomycetia bacterium]|nr:hypothetical protein [Actinomycetes bacterium]
MAELTMLSTGLLRSSCVVVDEGHDVGRIEPSTWPGRARVVVGRDEFELRRDRPWGGSYRLRRGGADGPEVARADGSAFKRRFVVTLEPSRGDGPDVSCELNGSRMMARWSVDVDGQPVGTIRPLSGTRLRGRASLPDELGPVGQLFCCALVVVTVGRSGLPRGSDQDITP